MRYTIALLALLIGCQSWDDPDDTGLLIDPPSGAYDEPVDLSIRNVTGETVDLSIWINEQDPPLLLSLDDGQQWSEPSGCRSFMGVGGYAGWLLATNVAETFAETPGHSRTWLWTLRCVTSS